MCPSGKLPALIRDTNLRSALRLAFDVLDNDRDGKISRDDLQAFYGVLPEENAFVPADDDVIGMMISAADSNSDGFVEYDEFERVIDGVQRHCGGVMEDVFRVMDKDGDGRLSPDDLKNYMTTVAGLQVNDEDIWAMIRLCGGDEKEGVGYDGFLKILSNE